jgi:hypothetical protein
VQLAHCMAPTTAAGAGREQEENRLQSELSSLGVDFKRKNELNGKEELEAHATTIKKVYFQDYKTAYDDNDIHKEIDKSHFGHLI